MLFEIVFGWYIFLYYVFEFVVGVKCDYIVCFDGDGFVGVGVVFWLWCFVVDVEVVKVGYFDVVVCD